MGSMNIRFRPTTANDIAFVVAIESLPDNSMFVTSQSEETHRQYLLNPDVSHWIIENDEKKPLGYIILVGVEQRVVIEFRRIVIVEKGAGIGRTALRWIKHFAFEECKVHRLWLDVVTNNDRACHLYRSEGFLEEGVLRECIKTPSGWNSLMVMSMLAHEYTPTTL